MSNFFGCMGWYRARGGGWKWKKRKGD